MQVLLETVVISKGWSYNFEYYSWPPSGTEGGGTLTPTTGEAIRRRHRRGGEGGEGAAHLVVACLRHLIIVSVLSYCLA